MPFTQAAPTIAEMLAAVDANTATLAEVATVANGGLAREGKADGWYARYASLVTKCASGGEVKTADVFPAKPVVDAAVAAVAPVGDASWKQLTDAVLAAAPSANAAQVAAFASKLIRAM